MLVRIIFLFLIFLPRCIHSQTSSRAIFTVVELKQSHAILRTTSRCSPGTYIAFETKKGIIYLVLYQKLSDDTFIAKLAPNYVGQTQTTDLMIGALGWTDSPRLSHIPARISPDNFWINLDNLYLNYGTAWLVLQKLGMQKIYDSSSINSNPPQIAIGDTIGLDASKPPIGGFVCLLEPRNDNIVVVYFPNDRRGTDFLRQFVKLTPRYNLTYHDDDGTLAFTNIGAQADKPGPTYFVVLISQIPRPLSDFLPEGHRVKYMTWDMKPIKPWEIGPGFFHKGAPQKKLKDVDYLPGDSWAIGRYEVMVVNK